MRTPAIPRRQRRHTHRRLTEFLFRHHLVPAGDHRAPPRRAPSHATELAGGPESTQLLLEMPACRQFYLNRVDLSRVAIWRKLQRSAICCLKSKLNTKGVGNRAVWKARGRGRVADGGGTAWPAIYACIFWWTVTPSRCGKVYQAAVHTGYSVQWYTGETAWYIPCDKHDWGLVAGVLPWHRVKEVGRPVTSYFFATAQSSDPVSGTWAVKKRL